MKFRPLCKDDYQMRLQHFLANDLEKFMSAISDVQITPAANTKDPNTSLVGLKDMPVSRDIKYIRLTNEI